MWLCVSSFLGDKSAYGLVVIVITMILIFIVVVVFTIRISVVVITSTISVVVVVVMVVVVVAVIISGSISARCNVDLGYDREPFAYFVSIWYLARML
jgi:hypothetical protein